MNRKTIFTLLLAVLTAASVAVAGTAGSLDTEFGIDGILTDDGHEVTALIVQSDGKLVAAGRESTGSFEGVSTSGWLVRRYGTDGTVDTDFGAGGELALFGDYGGDMIADMALAGDDGIVLAGRAVIAETTTKGNGKKTETSYTTKVVVVRLLSDGSFDTDFATDGIATLDVEGSVGAVAVQDDGKVVVAGSTLAEGSGGSKKGKGNGKGGGSTESSRAVLLLRLTSTGSLDGGFGDGGVAVHDLTTGDDSVQLHCMGLQSGGKIVIGGDAGADGFAITRYDSDGARDSTFPTITESGDHLLALTIDGSDSILAAGTRSRGPGDTDTMVVRYDSDGARDSGFGANGEYRASLTEANGPFSLAVGPAGQVVVGITEADLTGLRVLQLTSGGGADTGFGTDGLSGIVEAGDLVGGIDIALDGDGDVYIGGRVHVASPYTVEWLLASIRGS